MQIQTNSTKPKLLITLINRTVDKVQIEHQKEREIKYIEKTIKSINENEKVIKKCMIEIRIRNNRMTKNVKKNQKKVKHGTAKMWDEMEEVRYQNTRCKQ